jgi:hypothetical protein
LDEFGLTELNVLQRMVEGDIINSQGDDVGVVLVEVLPFHAVGFILGFQIVNWR